MEGLPPKLLKSEDVLKSIWLLSLVGAGSTALHYAACGGNAQCCQVRS